MKLDEIDNWDQHNVIHCPAKGCKGMLLESIDCYEFKCSDCNKYWDRVVEWKEIKE